MRRTPSVGQGVSLVGTRSFHSSNLIFGLGFLKWIVGGITPFSNIRMALIIPAIPAAASRWPI
jgi:hypothetical protein